MNKFRFKFTKNLLAFLAVVILSYTPLKGQVPENGLKKYEYGQVALVGKIKKKMIYGAPGFGEEPKTDRKVMIYVLVLEHPIFIAANPNSIDGVDTGEHAEVKEIHPYPYSFKFSKYKIKKVEVQGTLHESITAMDYTDVYMDVDEIKILSKAGN